jgi:putative spermidine/putrescine transport system ATP-binding protein
VRARVDEMLRLVELEGYQDRLPRQLSGGQQQRVALARVLATDPRVLLFDEPLSALDRNLRDTLKYAILDLQRRTGKTAIYVTHDQSEAFAISDRVAVMNGGRIEQIGSQTDIYLRPATQFVASFIGANNVIASTVVAVEGDGEERRVQVSAGSVSLWCRSQADVAVGDRALAYVRPEDIGVLEDDEVKPPGANIIEGTISRVIFEGPSAQLRVDVDGRDVRVDVTGGRRLTLEQRGHVRLVLAHVTLIREDAGAPGSQVDRPA